MAERETGIGIDLGTSNSAVCRLDTGMARFDFQHARGDGGLTEIPSAVAAHRGHLLFGSGAVRREAVDPKNVLRNFKLLLRSNQPVVLDGQEYQPVELTHRFLAYLKETYEHSFGAPLTRAVITVPAYEEFDADYQARIQAAVRGVGSDQPLFDDVVTLKEPDAVLMSLIELDRLQGKRVLVFDMGGGTLDVAIREVSHNPRDPDRPLLRSLCVAGSDVAGVRLTEALGHHALDMWEQKNKVTFSPEERDTAIRLNFGQLDDLKRQLSTYGRQNGMDSGQTDLCHLAFAGKGQGYFDVEVSARVLTELSEALCEDAIDTVNKALAEAGLLPGEIDAYFAVGGTSQLPLMQEKLTEYFGKEPTPKVSDHGFVDPYLAISKGAAVYDWDREDTVHSVPNTAPELEQKLAYDISLLVNGRQALQVIHGRGTVLPAVPADKTFYMPRASDHLDIELYRGSGAPEDARPMASRRLTFPTHLAMDAPVNISIGVDRDGTMTITALGGDSLPITATLESITE